MINNPNMASLSTATINEIVDRYNYFSIHELWDDQTIKLFYQELLSRVLSDATFSFTVTSESIGNPVVQVGFEESYDVLGLNNQPIYEEQDISYSVLSNDELPEKDQERIIGYVIEGEVYVELDSEMKFTEISDNKGIPVQIIQTPEFNQIYQMLRNLQTGELTSAQELEEVNSSDPIDEEITPLPTTEQLLERREDYHRLWDKIHSSALRSVTPLAMTRYANWIWNLAKNIPCCECKYHALRYIQENPPEQERDAFYWSWKFHNEVNDRLNKGFFDYELALEKYQ